MTVGAVLVGASSSRKPGYLRAHRTSAAIYQVLLGLAFLGSALAGPLSHVQLGSISGQGLLTIGIALLSWGLLIASWPIRDRTEGSLRPLAAFTGWVVLSLFWSPAITTGAQNVLVWTVFVTSLFVSRRFSSVVPWLRPWTAKLLVTSTVVAVLLYGLSMLWSGLGTNVLWGNRTFAMFCLPGLAWFLAGWRQRQPNSLWASVGILTMIALSLSRTGLAMAAVLLVLCQVLGRARRRLVRAAVGVALAGAVVAGAVHFVAPLRERFTIESGSDEESDLNAYSSGRLAVWSVVVPSALESPWVGKGAGAGRALVAETFPEVLGHPHSDYLAVFHDNGLVGLCLFLVSIVHLLRMCRRGWMHARDPLAARLGLASLLGLSGAAMLMVIENVLVMVFVMAPLGLLIGTALATPRQAATLARRPAS